MSTKYQYTPLDSAGLQIRLLTLPFEIKQVLGKRHDKPLTGSLTNYYLPSPSLSRVERTKRSSRLPIFCALSYVWGHGARPQEILIDGKSLPITANLYAALRDLQADAFGGAIQVWVDAICINQDDFAERSAQIRLMRDIYHLASDVKVWLGPRTDETTRCSIFIARLNGDGISKPSEDDEPSVLEEAFMSAVLVPTGVIVQAGFDFGQRMINLGDIISPDVRDDKATIVLDSDSNFSLHQQTIEQLVRWRPSARHLQRAQKEENFTEMAHLIDREMLQKSEWFERMWVVQEVGAAEHVSLQYGELSIYWSSFLKVVHYLYYACNIPMENISKVTGLEKIRLGYNAGKRQPLRDLLWDTRYRHGTDPRDKIYSLLGLMGDPMGRLLQPDYTKSVSEVYSNATHHLVAQNRSLNPICGQQVQGRREDLPTWVPDYSLNRDLAASPLVRIDGGESIYAATGYDYHSEFLIPDISTLPESWETLHVNGLYVDTISHTSSLSSDDESFGFIQDKWYSTLLGATGSLKGFTEDIRVELADISSMVGRYSEYFSSEDPNLDITTETVLNPVKIEVYILDAYIHTLLCGRMSSGERITKDDMKALMSFQSPDKSSSTTKKDFMNKTCNAFEAGMKRRKLAITKDGYIGAVPRETKPDDLICVLFGCSVPVVLRKINLTKGNSSKTSYQFIGESYLHGFMDAEAIAMLVKGTCNVQDFTLK
jgi:hypothetical protein